jgi:hypothetical protein
MSIPATVAIFDEQDRILVNLYWQSNGHFESLGKKLANFLEDTAIINKIKGNNPTKAANGMGCLAAQVIKHFKEEIGNIYIALPKYHEAYNYEIRYIQPNGFRCGRVSLTGYCGDKIKEFNLYSNWPSAKILYRVQFVYGETKNNEAKWRVVDVSKENDLYLEGFEESGAFKRFSKSKILGGKILPA